jgi:hypothetical protein
VEDTGREEASSLVTEAGAVGSVPVVVEEDGDEVVESAEEGEVKSSDD